MAIEEEFGIEIPDAEADEITTVQEGKCNRVARSCMSLMSSCRVHCQGMLSPQ